MAKNSWTCDWEYLDEKRTALVVSELIFTGKVCGRADRREETVVEFSGIGFISPL